MTVQRSDENDKNIERVRVSVCDLVRTSLILHHQLVGIFTGAWLSWCFCVSSVSFSKLHPEHPSCSSPKYGDGFKIIKYDDRDNNHTETPFLFFIKVVLFCANDDQFSPHRARRCCCPCQCRHPAVRSGLLRWLKSPSLACALTWLAFRNCGSCDSIYDNDENLWPVLGSKHCEERGEEKKSVEETKHDGQHKNL